MDNYIRQLISDIREAEEGLCQLNSAQSFDIRNWISEEEEDRSAPIRNLQDWTGIRQEMLPPSKILSDSQVIELLIELKKLLDTYNCLFVLQTEVPIRIQYETIRENFDQDVKVKSWHMGFFEVCKKGTERGKCVLREFCQCAFYEDLFKDQVIEDLSPDEERARHLEIEVNHIKRKHGDDWMKYYPYHLDPAYDNENGEPYNYGFDEDDEEDEDDNWWRR